MYKGGITKHPDKILSEKECVPGLAKKEKKKKLRLTNLFKFPKPLKNFHIKGWKKIFPPWLEVERTFVTGKKLAQKKEENKGEEQTVLSGWVNKRTCAMWHFYK